MGGIGSGQTVGLVSYGMITKHFVRMLQPFSPKIKVYSSHLDEMELKANHMEKARLPKFLQPAKSYQSIRVDGKNLSTD